MITERDKNLVVSNLYRCGIITDIKDASDMFNNGRLSFMVPKTNNLPSNINDVFVTLIFDIKCGEDKFENEVKKEIEEKADKNVKFEIQSYSQFVFSIQFSGKDDKGIEYLSGWHLDYEPKTKYPFLKEPKVYHPLFHLHYGGSNLREVYRELNMHQDFFDDKSCTNALIEDIKALLEDRKTKDKIDEVFLTHVTKSSEIIQNAVTRNKKSYVPLYMIAPRIPFPPMDEYLGLDFIISNFFEKPKYDTFRKNVFFHNKIVESQNKLWKDYYGIINGYWNNKSSNITPNMLIPSLFK
ncbi:MAG: hypothetical protein MJ198_08285 [Bacteroidales bacterium]|nr:hypothetical protein [Bacteroidales bacterium]